MHWRVTHDQLSAKAAGDATAALLTPVLASLFPLVQLGSPFGVAVSDTLPPALLRPATLLSITRCQVIEILSRLSREHVVVSGEAHGIREQVLELCLEHIGHCWRAGIDRSEEVVEGIARQLTEIEFEVSR